MANEFDSLSALAECHGAILTKTAEQGERLRTLEARLAMANDLPFESTARGAGTLAGSIRKDSGFEALLRGESRTYAKRFDLHGLITKSALITSNDTAQAQRVPGVVGIDPGRTSWIQQLVPTSRTSAANVEYVRETGTRRDAASQAGGSPLQREAVGKKESPFTTEAISLPVATVAHWTETSRQLADDVPSLTAFLGGALIDGVMYSLEAQILGDGSVPGEIDGVRAPGNHTVFNAGVTGDNELDTLRRAVAMVQVSNMTPDLILLNPLDFATIELAKSTSGGYLAGEPRGAEATQLWGCQVYASAAMDEGEFVVMSAAQATQLWIREDALLRVSDSHSDNFTSNVLTWLAEGRYAFGVVRPSGVVFGIF
jgi:HK97 family phage major capsid protein